MPTTPASVSRAAKLESLKAQEQQLKKSVENPTLSTSSSAQGENNATVWWTTQNAMTVSTVILVFGAVVVGIAAYLIRKETDGQVILKVLATILIITFSVFLIVAGWSDQQIGPAMGLLGTIAGYLLGKDTRAPVNPANKPE